MIRNEKGITLVELMVVLALLGIILAVGYNLFFYGQRSFAFGEAQSNLQRDIRLTSDFITREARYALNIEVINIDPSGHTFQDEYNYIYRDNNTIKYRPAGSNPSVVAKTDPIIDNLLFNLFKIEGVDRYLLSFNIEGSLQNRTYSISSDVMLYNIEEAIPSTGSAIKYQKP